MEQKVKKTYHVIPQDSSVLDEDLSPTDSDFPRKPSITKSPSQKINEKTMTRLFWILFIVLIVYPFSSILNIFRVQTAIIFSFSEKQHASSFYHNQRILCKMMPNPNISAFCKSYDVVDVIDLAWAIAPLYTCRGEVDHKLYDLHRNFIGYLNSYGIPTIQIEGVKANSNQEYQLARPNMEPYEIQSYIHNCSYLRENLLNVAIKKLDKPWEYMMWIDAHQVFEDPLWIYKAIVLAEKHAVVQLFKMIRRFDATNSSILTKQGYISSTLVGRFLRLYRLEFGNAFILRRELYEKIGHILDECIANDCDVTYNKAAFPYVWEYDLKYPKYAKSLFGWLENAKKIFNGSRAFLPSDIYHINHQSGTFPWEELHKVLEWNDFNISRDIKRNQDFTLYVSNNKIAQEMEEVVNTGVAKRST